MRVVTGALHPNGTNFKRNLQFNIVQRMRRMVASGMYARPDWLEAVERNPPPELYNMKLQCRTIRNPYPRLISDLLKKYPDLRFQDLFVDGNDWSRGNDRYRDDHPVMQFVARQLQLMNSGVSKAESFRQTEEEFRSRRETLEVRQKVEMALAANQEVVPAFGSAKMPNPLYPNAEAYARQREAQLEIAHLRGIQHRLRLMRDKMINEERKFKKKELLIRPTEAEAEKARLLLLVAQRDLRPSENWFRSDDAGEAKEEGQVEMDDEDTGSVTCDNPYHMRASPESEDEEDEMGTEASLNDPEGFDFSGFLEKIRLQRLSKESRTKGV